ncbi:MAG: AsnC family transcriptional regulator [Halobacteriaceae archaeon]
MPNLDETDLEILQLLLADARRPYSDIAEIVGLSPPAVSERITKLQELGVIRRFTVDIDRSQLQDNIPVLVTIDLGSDIESLSAVKSAFLDRDAVDHVFITAAGNVVVYMHVTDTNIPDQVTNILEDYQITSIDVELIDSAEWSPDLAGVEFALTCAQCGNTVDSEGTAARIDGELYQFCCPSCESRFQDKYDQLQQEAD